MNFFQFLFSKPDESTNDKLGAYPEKVHVRAMPERRYLKTSRSMTLLSSALICSMMVLSFTIYLLSPMLRAEPLLMAIDKRFYKLEPIQPSVIRFPANQLLLQTYVEEYVRLRHTYIADIDVMKERWLRNSAIFWFSSPDTYTFFFRTVEAKLKQIMNGLSSEVQIRFTQNIFHTLWVCEFDTIEYQPEQEYPVRRRWRAYLEAGYQARAYPNRDEQIKNPINFYVNSYYVGSRGIHADDKNAKFVD